MFMKLYPGVGVHKCEAQFIVPDCGDKVDYIRLYPPSQWLVVPARQAT
jgi:hypothetical protein